MMPVQIANFFIAMQAGRLGAEALAALFAEDAIYTEPFSGAPQRHEGRAAVMRAMAQGWEQPMPDMRIEVERVETRGDEIALDWICHSPVLPGGAGRGHNRYRMQGGLIAELETTMRAEGG